MRRGETAGGVKDVQQRRALCPGELRGYDTLVTSRAGALAIWTARLSPRTDKEGAAPTFKMGYYGFHPLGAWLANTAENLAMLLRPGNAGSNTFLPVRQPFRRQEITMSSTPVSRRCLLATIF